MHCHTEACLYTCLCILHYGSHRAGALVGSASKAFQDDNGKHAADLPELKQERNYVSDIEAEDAVNPFNKRRRIKVHLAAVQTCDLCSHCRCLVTHAELQAAELWSLDTELGNARFVRYEADKAAEIALRQQRFALAAFNQVQSDRGACQTQLDALDRDFAQHAHQHQHIASAAEKPADPGLPQAFHECHLGLYLRGSWACTESLVLQSCQMQAHVSGG